jgi:two-component system cell cycle response regulator CpdR
MIDDASAAAGPIDLQRVIDEVRGRGATAAIDLKHEAKGLVRDPRTVERLVLDLIIGICSSVTAKRIVLNTRDLVRVDPKGQPGRWTELVIHEPAGATDPLEARIRSTLLVARARLAATLLIAGDGRSPSAEVEQSESGTTVRLVLPCSEPEDVSRPVVLVADDDEIIRQAVCEALRAEGCHVIAAPSGPAALERASGKIALLITDIVMPGMNGIELARRLTERQPGLKVVFMSALPLTRGALVPGSFLYKPLDLNKLVGQLPALIAELRGTEPARRPLAAV